MPTEKKVSIKVAREKVVSVYGALSERNRRELKEELERLAESDYRVSAIKRHPHAKTVDIVMAKVDDWSVDELLDEAMNAMEKH